MRGAWIRGKGKEEMNVRNVSQERTEGRTTGHHSVSVERSSCRVRHLADDRPREAITEQTPKLRIEASANPRPGYGPPTPPAAVNGW